MRFRFHPDLLVYFFLLSILFTFLQVSSCSACRLSAFLSKLLQSFEILGYFSTRGSSLFFPGAQRLLSGLCEILLG